MPDLVCDTSAIQYLHQLGLLHVLRELSERVLLPPAVRDELDVGRQAGVDLPELTRTPWLEIVHPCGEKDVRLLSDMGPGETGVMMLALETEGLVAVLDDRLARKRAALLRLSFTGTLGLILDAKKAGLVPAVVPILDRLETLQFRLAPRTRRLVLRCAGEAEAD